MTDRPARPVGGGGGQRGGRAAFTLIELLVVVAVIAALLALLTPAIFRARRLGEDMVCRSNQHQVGVSLWTYASSHDTRSPAVGQPYGLIPNWALVVLKSTDEPFRGTSLYSTGPQILYCPTSRRDLGRFLARSYAINGTGHSGLPAGALGPGSKPDRDDYEDPDQRVHLRMELAPHPSSTPLVIESTVVPDAPLHEGRPIPITHSVIDFRLASHLNERIGRPHDNGKGFHSLAFDGSVSLAHEVKSTWQQALP